MLKFRSTVHEVAWQFNSFAYSSGLMLGQVVSTIAFRSMFSSNRSPKRTEPQGAEIVLKHVFESHFYMLRNT